MIIRYKEQDYDTRSFPDLRDFLTNVLENNSLGTFVHATGILLSSGDFARPGEAERADAAQTLETLWNYFQTRYTPQQVGYGIGVEIVGQFTLAWLGENALEAFFDEVFGGNA